MPAKSRYPDLSLFPKYRISILTLGIIATIYSSILISIFSKASALGRPAKNSNRRKLLKRATVEIPWKIGALGKGLKQWIEFLWQTATALTLQCVWCRALHSKGSGSRSALFCDCIKSESGPAVVGGMGQQKGFKVLSTCAALSCTAAAAKTFLKFGECTN